MKAIKHYMRRVMGNEVITFEDLYILMVKIECVLNSRPFTTIFSDPSLTPAHFLMGRAITTMPDPSLEEIQDYTLSRFQHLQKLLQLFLIKWSKECISRLLQ